MESVTKVLTRKEMNAFAEDIDDAASIRADDEKVSAVASIVLGAVGIATGGLSVGIASVLLGTYGYILDNIENAMDDVNSCVKQINNMVSGSTFQKVELKVTYDKATLQSAVYNYPTRVQLIGVQDAGGTWIYVS